MGSRSRIEGGNSRFHQHYLTEHAHYGQSGGQPRQFESELDPAALGLPAASTNGSRQAAAHRTSGLADAGSERSRKQGGRLHIGPDV